MPDAPDAPPPDGYVIQPATPEFVSRPIRILARTNWFLVALVALCLTSTGLRFWGLNRINSLVFDEVYFAKFAEDYRTGKDFFDIAPPLSKYLIAIGISVGLKLEKPTDNTNEDVGERMAPFTYRWMNALLGSLITPGIAALAWLLSKNRRFTLLATFLFTMDGLFLVDARLALTNTALVLFGVYATCVFLLAPRSVGWKRWGLVVLAGVLFGCSAGTKWNGLGFFAGAGLVWFVAWGTRIARWGRPRPKDAEPPGPVERLGELSILHAIACIAVFGLTYVAIWIPHLVIYPKDAAHPSNRSFFEWQTAMLDAHNATGGTEAHGYCSKWFTWPFLIRPVAYYYVTDKQPGQNPGDPEVTIVRDIHAIANPAVCWLGTIALFGILGTGGWTWGTSYVRWLWSKPPPEQPWSLPFWLALVVPPIGLAVGGVLIAVFYQNFKVLFGLAGVFVAIFALGTLVALYLRDRAAKGKPFKRRYVPSIGLFQWAQNAWLEVIPPADETSWLAFFLVANYVVNTLPWVGVHRCLFFYHYMEAYVFAILALAYLLPKWCASLGDYELATVKKIRVTLGGETIFWIVVGVVFAAFIFWLPIFIGLPITSEEFYRRMWLERWI